MISDLLIEILPSNERVFEYRLQLYQNVMVVGFDRSFWPNVKSSVVRLTLLPRKHAPICPEPITSCTWSSIPWMRGKGKGKGKEEEEGTVRRSVLYSVGLFHLQKFRASVSLFPPAATDLELDPNRLRGWGALFQLFWLYLIVFHAHLYNPQGTKDCADYIRARVPYLRIYNHFLHLPDHKLPWPVLRDPRAVWGGLKKLRNHNNAPRFANWEPLKSVPIGCRPSDAQHDQIRAGNSNGFKHFCEL